MLLDEIDFVIGDPILRSELRGFVGGAVRHDADTGPAGANRSRTIGTSAAPQRASTNQPIRARAELVSARTALINAARGLAKSYGERLPRRGSQRVGRELAAQLSTALREVLEPCCGEPAAMRFVAPDAGNDSSRHGGIAIASPGDAFTANFPYTAQKQKSSGSTLPRKTGHSDSRSTDKRASSRPVYVRGSRYRGSPSRRRLFRHPVA
jgi:hypothetical protein